MVTKKFKDKKEYFTCENCGFTYKRKELAEKCEKFCGRYKACGPEITKYAVNAV